MVARAGAGRVRAGLRRGYGHQGRATTSAGCRENDGSAGDRAQVGRQQKRHRATTLNWGDPAVRHGGQPTGASDRYLLAITFLRVVGAAHFPIQGRQKTGQKLNVDLELPRSWRKLPDMPGLWELCERSLSLVNAADRPAPAEWVASWKSYSASCRRGSWQGRPPSAGRPAARGSVERRQRCRSSPRAAERDGPRRRRPPRSAPPGALDMAAHQRRPASRGRRRGPFRCQHRSGAAGGAGSSAWASPVLAACPWA